MKEPQPFHVKFGWDREKLAEYMLSRISYTAKPSTVSDDLGTDIFCTLFQVKEMNGHQYRLPLSSFAVQVRSTDATSDFSKNIQYLKTLKIPFFWGVLDESAKRLTLFSGENLQVFFHHVGEVRTLKIKPLERNQINQMNAPYHPEESRKCHYTVMFPKVLDMDINQTREDLRGVVSKLQEICSLMQGNISTSTMNEYIFEHYGGRTVTILAGPQSAKQFRDNFMKRLAENFHNLKWIYHQLSDDVLKQSVLNEFKIYEDTYLKICRLRPYVICEDAHLEVCNSYPSVPSYLEDIYKKLGHLLHTDGTVPTTRLTNETSSETEPQAPILLTPDE